MAVPRQTADDDVKRAATRVTLACRALSTAASDLRIAHRRSGVMAVEDAADLLNVETERVCELAEELGKLGRNLATRPLEPLGGS
jgi:predicted transcriptional regulator of viral defense system